MATQYFGMTSNPQPTTTDPLADIWNKYQPEQQVITEPPQLLFDVSSEDLDILNVMRDAGYSNSELSWVADQMRMERDGIIPPSNGEVYSIQQAPQYDAVTNGPVYSQQGPQYATATNDPVYSQSPTPQDQSILNENSPIFDLFDLHPDDFEQVFQAREAGMSLEDAARLANQLRAARAQRVVPDLYNATNNNTRQMTTR